MVTAFFQINISGTFGGSWEGGHIVKYLHCEISPDGTFHYEPCAGPQKEEKSKKFQLFSFVGIFVHRLGLEPTIFVLENPRLVRSFLLHVQKLTRMVPSLCEKGNHNALFEAVCSGVSALTYPVTSPERPRPDLCLASLVQTQLIVLVHG